MLVDLRSDTLTKPTDAMRKAMAAAEVGDDVFGEDPTVNRLQDRVAELLGKEAAIFVPSGTMANLLAFMTQLRAGETIILSDDAHPYNYEAGNIAAVGGFMTRTVRGEMGRISRESIEPYVVQTPDHHYSNTSVISVENTTNRGGGNYYSLETIRDIRKLTNENQMRVHCDGARLFHAVVEANYTAAEFAAHCDTLCFCFSKGLGCPVGSVLSGPRETIDEAHRFRKMLGGGMRQVGVLAAAAEYALDHHIDRLREDHRRAREFRTAIEDLPGVSFPFPTPTNIVIFEVPDVLAFIGAAGSAGVLTIPMGGNRVRAVFHLDIDDAMLAQAIDAVRNALNSIPAEA
jgi:threonine aldolase